MTLQTKPIPSEDRFRELLNRRIVEKSTDEAWIWCEKWLHFDEAGNRGPFTTSGAEYVREILNDFADSSIMDEVLVMGSQTRKTGTLMGGCCYRIANAPAACLWVTPSMGFAAKFTRQRWKKLLLKSPGTRGFVPTKGQGRHDFTTLVQLLGSSSFNFVGSNSAANLSSAPCNLVIQDEVDKFDRGDSQEADASNLADQRTKGQPNAQRWKTSTPTTIGGLIWQSFLKGNQKRFFLHCPKCAGEILLAWSKRFTVFKLLGCEAFVKWDGEAKDERTGEWDLERVERTAHYECPHCKARITDVSPLLKKGYWKATNPGAQAGYVSRHLSSLYSSMPECRVGKLAVKFLQAKRSVLGLRGFINGDLAEPECGQEVSVERVELVSRIDNVSEGVPTMTVDCQQKQPYFWWVKRVWFPGKCHGVAAGSAETYQELREIQLDKACPVMDKLVWLDSGFQARSGEAEVYRNCAQYGDLLQNGDKLAHIGWMPTKGFAARKRWRDSETGEMVPYYMAPLDPFLGTEDAGKVQMHLFEFSAEFFKDILDNLRTRRGEFAQTFQWSVAENIMQDMTTYWKHMDGQHRVTKINKFTGHEKVEWAKRNKHWPDHLFACEYGQIALAMFNGWLTLESKR